MNRKYTIADDHTYTDAIRIRIEWKGTNRLLWVYRGDLNEFLSHPENFRETTRLIDTGKEWYETRGRLKFSSRGTIMRWQAFVVKKGINWKDPCDWIFVIIVLIAFTINPILGIIAAIVWWAFR